jgi:dynein heavy chain
LTRTQVVLQEGIFDDIRSAPDEVLEKLEQIYDQMKVLQAEANMNIEYEQLLEMALTDQMQKAIAKCQEDIDLKKKLWNSVKSWRTKTSSWMAASLNMLSTDKMNTEINSFAATIAECARVMLTSSVIASMKDSLDQFKVLLPLIQDLKSPALKARHWQEMWEAVGAPFPTNDELTVHKILQINLVKCMYLIYMLNLTFK